MQVEQKAAVAELDRLAAEQRALDAKRAATTTTAKAGPTATAAGASPATPPVVKVSGSWVCPVQGPHSFSDDYGQPRPGGRNHQGNDILAPRGTPVVANVAGDFEQHDNGLGGIAYFLNGSDGRQYYGAHLDSFSGATGHVAAGTVIGAVGDSGNAKGGPTHLHFEIHVGGSTVNPYPTLKQYC